MRRVRLLLHFCMVAALWACGSEAPTQLTIDLSAQETLTGNPTRVVFYIKNDTSGDDGRLIYEGQSEFAYQGDISQHPISIGLRPGEEFSGMVDLYVQVRSETSILATGGGQFNLSESDTGTIILELYEQGCDNDSDGFLRCFDASGTANGCCAHLDPTSWNTLSDCVDNPETLASTYESFDESNPYLTCSLERLSANDINPFVATGIEDTACRCSNTVDEDCFGGDFACSEIDADNDGYHLTRDCDDNDENVFPGAPEYGDTIDNDCDGQVDEVTCGIDRDDDGQCPPQDCLDSDPGIYEGAPENPNNGIDEDCDGRDTVIQEPDDRDRDGFIDILEGGDDCNDLDAGIYPGASEPCGSNVDNDCDGSLTECSVSDEDGDGFVSQAAGGTDCDDSSASVYPGAPELCDDGFDQDCNGEDVSCVNDADNDGFNAEDDCNDESPVIYPGAPEYCDGQDNNCNDLIDEGNPLQASADAVQVDERCSPSEYEEVGECAFGYSVCSESDGLSIYLCAYAIVPTEELCDGLDNDCDNLFDEDNPDGGSQCTVTDALGECASGIEVCIEDGSGELLCEGQEPDIETCDLLDNDCDGFIDENDDNPEAPLTEPCYTGAEGTEGLGLCQGGFRTCQAELGRLSDICEGEVRPREESCSNAGSDDDCDGIEDNIQLEGSTCIVSGEESLGICAEGLNVCSGDELICESIQSPLDETCTNPGSDDNCDGIIDNIAGLGDSCLLVGIPGVDNDYCREGEVRCTALSSPTCVATYPRSDETCGNMGEDNNCDGILDNIPGLGDTCLTGLYGACANGSLACADEDSFECTPLLEPGEEREALLECDGVDNDCNGLVDDLPGIGGSCDTGLDGICQEGTLNCRGSGVSAECQPDYEVSDPSSSFAELICNGLDDDCDGDIDEGFLNTTTGLYDLDHQNCGDCGVSCGDATNNACCVEGGTGLEAAVCVNTDINEDHCGDCNTACEPNEFCFEGECYCADGDSCDSGEFCSSTFGSCRCGDSPACESTEFCSGAQCICNGQICGSGEACVDDAEGIHCECGGCGDDEICVDGSCQCLNDEACSGSRVCWLGQCIDPDVTDAACGEDLVNCPENTSCQDGLCVCGDDESVCDAFAGCVPVGGGDFECRCGDDELTCDSGETCSISGECNCGDGPSCGLNEICLDGSCICPSDLLDCASDEVCCAGNGCTDIYFDELNCGGCDISCNPGELCVNGSCQCDGGDSCDTGLFCCENNGCTDISTNSLFCGECLLDSEFTASFDFDEDLACATSPSAEECVDGSCQFSDCIAPFADCGGPPSDCETDTSSNESHCGDCGNVCDTLETCSAGDCLCDGAECGGSSFCCDSGCQDLDSDENNCGSCGFACDDGEVCSGGSCLCAGSSGLESCDSSESCCDGVGCVDINTDTDHCGECGRACDTSHVSILSCNSGVCNSTCDAGYCNLSLPSGFPDDGCEVDTGIDENNCGDCGWSCGESQSCEDGFCSCEDTGDCDNIGGTDELVECCDNDSGEATCRFTSGDDWENCGACGWTCAGDGFCDEGLCLCSVVNDCDDVGNPGDSVLCCDEDVSDYCRVVNAADTENCGDCGQLCDDLESCVGGVCE